MNDPTQKADWWPEWIIMIFGSRDAWRCWAMAAIRKQEAERA